jgi:hypothetical protein
MRKLALLFLLLPFSLCTYGCSERPTESNTVAATDGLVFAKRVAGPERKLDYTFVLPEVIHRTTPSFHQSMASIRPASVYPWLVT